MLGGPSSDPTSSGHLLPQAGEGSRGNTAAPAGLRSTLAVVTAASLAVLPASAAPQHAEHPRPIAAKKPATPQPAPAPATPAPPSDTRPYDPQLMRLSEILGALSYLGKLCATADADQWRARMQALLDAEGNPAPRKDRLAGAFNRGVSGYALSYRACTPNAHLVIERFLREGTSLAKEVENRYRAS